MLIRREHSGWFWIQFSSQLRDRTKDCSDDIFVLAIDSNFSAAGPPDIGKFHIHGHVFKLLIYLEKTHLTYTYRHSAFASLSYSKTTNVIVRLLTRRKIQRTM